MTKRIVLSLAAVLALVPTSVATRAADTGEAGYADPELLYCSPQTTSSTLNIVHSAI